VTRKKGSRVGLTALKKKEEKEIKKETTKESQQKKHSSRHAHIPNEKNEGVIAAIDKTTRIKKKTDAQRRRQDPH